VEGKPQNKISKSPSMGIFLFWLAYLVQFCSQRLEKEGLKKSKRPILIIE
jgi:hypothetical protein